MKIWQDLSLFGEYVTWRDWSIVITGLIIVVVSIIMFRNWRHIRKFNCVMCWLTMVVILFAEVFGTVACKYGLRMLDAAASYEAQGDYQSAYVIYLKLYDDYGDWQDLVPKMEECLLKMDLSF